MSEIDYKVLLKYCKTDKQKEVVELKKFGFTNKQTAEQLGIKTRAVRERLQTVKDYASLHGYSPEHDMTKEAPPTHIVKGTSTLYKFIDENGNTGLQWVKTNVKMEDQLKAIENMVEALKDDIPKARKSIAPIERFSEDFLAVYPMGDPHIGLMTWKDETGDNHDLKLGTEQLISAVIRLVQTAPSCENALIVNLGDFFHSDLSDNKTQRSGHALDVDGRWAKILQAGIKAMRVCIEEALKRHNHVTVINAIGNHDDHSSMFLSVALSHIFENEPRVTIKKEPTATHYYRFGANLFGVHHGHDIKMPNLPLLMAAERSADWGQTKNRYWLTGHIHHDSRKDYNGCTVESFRTLAARDAFAAGHGYVSQRDMKCLVVHREFGEVERHTVNIDMLRAINPNL